MKATLSAKPAHAKSRLGGKRTFGALIVKGRADSVVAANILCRETGTIPGVALWHSAWAVITTPLNGPFYLKEFKLTHFSFRMLSTDRPTGIRVRQKAGIFLSSQSLQYWVSNGFCGGQQWPGSSLRHILDVKTLLFRVEEFFFL